MWIEPIECKKEQNGGNPPSKNVDGVVGIDVNRGEAEKLVERGKPQ